MATFTTPLVSAAARATAAAVAVATPVIAPSISAPAPAALSAANVQLTTFADLLSITPADWNNIFYTGWGGALQPINVDGDQYYWEAQCDQDCYIAGFSGLAYLGLDALLNGNGAGFQNVAGILEDPSKPYQPDPDQPNYNPYEVEPWGVSPLNYTFEGGAAIGLQYALSYPFLGEPYRVPGPLENYAITKAIELVFQGGFALTSLYVTALSLVAQAAINVPLVGEYLYRGIGSYLGPAFANIDDEFDYAGYAGIPGVLRYIGGVITTGGNPNPYPTTPPNAVAAVSALAAAKAVTASTVVEATESVAATLADKPAETVTVDSTPVSTPAAEAATDTTPAVDSPSAAVADSTAEAPAATAASEAPSKSATRPVRGALERAAKQGGSALGVAKADSAKPDSAKPDSAKADSAKADAATADSAPAASAGAATASSDAGSADSAG